MADLLLLVLPQPHESPNAAMHWLRKQVSEKTVVCEEAAAGGSLTKLCVRGCVCVCARACICQCIYSPCSCTVCCLENPASMQVPWNKLQVKCFIVIHVICWLIAWARARRSVVSNSSLVPLCTCTCACRCLVWHHHGNTTVTEWQLHNRKLECLSRC